MSDLMTSRATLIDLLVMRREKINRIPLKRRKSRKSTSREDLIGQAVLFEQWGFMDYIAARVLLLKILNACIKPPLPRRILPPDTPGEVVRRRDRLFGTNLLIAGNLVWPACALAATAVEKYGKAIITIASQETPRSIHLTRSLINQVGNSVKNLFCVINHRFVEDLGALYDLRYHTNAGGNPRVWTISVRGILAELDFTIAQLQGCVQVTINGRTEAEDNSYTGACRFKSQDLYQENHLLLGMEKLTFWQQHDLRGSLGQVSNGNLQRTWVPMENRRGADFFSIERRDLSIDLRKAQVQDENDCIGSLLKREATIVHYWDK